MAKCYRVVSPLVVEKAAKRQRLESFGTIIGVASLTRIPLDALQSHRAHNQSIFPPFLHLSPPLAKKPSEKALYPILKTLDSVKDMLRW